MGRIEINEVQYVTLCSIIETSKRPPTENVGYSAADRLRMGITLELEYLQDFEVCYKRMFEATLSVRTHFTNAAEAIEGDEITTQHPLLAEKRHPRGVVELGYPDRRGRC